MRIAKIDPDKVGENITPTPSTLVEAARKRLAAFEKEASETVAQANTTIADYYTTQYVASSVRQIRQPIVTRIGLDFSMVVVFLAAGAFGFIVSLIVTAIKISYANVARKKKAARDGDAAAVAEAANEKEETAEAKTE